MGLLNDNDMYKILHNSQMGLWRVEFEEGKEPRFFADEMMDELLGISGEVTPQERYVFHQARIHPDDRALFEEYATQIRNLVRESSAIHDRVVDNRENRKHQLKNAGAFLK